jgi:hypothetical protein
MFSSPHIFNIIFELQHLVNSSTMFTIHLSWIFYALYLPVYVLSMPSRYWRHPDTVNHTQAIERIT